MSMDFMTWLTAWIRRHPVQAPPQDAAYAPQVMARVAEPAPAYRVVVRPRLSWAMATVAACGMAMAVVVQHQLRQPARLAKALEHDLAVLSAAGEVDPLAGAELEQDAVLVDRMMLAEAQTGATDDAWIDDTVELLNKVEERALTDTSSSSPTAESPDELLREMEKLDERDMSSS